MALCEDCGKSFSITSQEKELFARQAFAYAPIPQPRRCSRCRAARRLLHRNERNFYHRTDASAGARSISLYSEDALWGEPYQVLPEERWRSDELDPFAYGMEFDFNKTFFEQYRVLHKAVPRMTIVNLENENCPYTSYTGYSKDSYLIPCSENCEECYYGRFLQKCRSCVDCTSVESCELCYECFSCRNCYHCFFLTLSENCSDCFFSENLTGCSNCIFCTNLQRRSYCILNKEVSKETFGRELKKILRSSAALSEARARWESLRENRIHRPANIFASEASSGDFIRHSNRCAECFDISGSEDCSHVGVAVKCRDCSECSHIYLDTELSHELAGAVTAYHCAYSLIVIRSSDVLYSEYVYDSQKIFGCVGMKRRHNCIFNRQYSESEYDTLASKIVRHMQKTGEWGEFFPPDMSPFGYNETVASDIFPLTREEVLRRGWLWREDKEKSRNFTISPFPENVPETDEQILPQVFACEKTGEAYRFIKPELAFYRREGLALPRICPSERHRSRERLKFGMEFYGRRCARCPAAIKTNIASDRPETVYCEKCFGDAVHS